MDTTDPLSTLFLICFLTGSVLMLLSFVGGFWAIPFHHGTMHLPGLHGSHATTGGGQVASGSAGTQHSHSSDASPFNTLSILTCVTWFGGAGYIVHTHWSVVGWLVVVLAAAVGIAAGGGVFLLLARVLLPHQTIMDPSDYTMVGTIARATSTVREGGTGEIVYTKGGTRRTDAARSETGSAIPRGAEVVIVRYERGIAYVEPWEQFLQRSRPSDG